MGYLTQYRLTVQPESDEVVRAIEAIKNDNNYYPIYSAWARIDNRWKWYNHPTDMKNFSKRFPDVLFTLSGEGEESGDIWRTYYKNGKSQHCKAVITFDKFDEKKLE